MNFSSIITTDVRAWYELSLSIVEERISILVKVNCTAWDRIEFFLDKNNPGLSDLIVFEEVDRDWILLRVPLPKSPENDLSRLSDLNKISASLSILFGLLVGFQWNEEKRCTKEQPQLLLIEEFCCRGDGLMNGYPLQAKISKRLFYWLKENIEKEGD